MTRKSGAESSQSLLTRTDFAHSFTGTQHRSASLLIQRLMIKSQSLQYACHGYGTGPGMTIADLDRDAAAIRAGPPRKPTLRPPSR